MNDSQKASELVEQYYRTMCDLAVEVHAVGCKLNRPREEIENEMHALARRFRVLRFLVWPFVSDNIAAAGDVHVKALRIYIAAGSAAHALDGGLISTAYADVTRPLN